MKDKKTYFNLGKGQLLKLKNICVCIDKINRVVYDDSLSDSLKIESIKMFLERFASEK